MRIAIKDVKELAKKYGLTHCVVLGFDGETQCIATYGKSVEQCDQAAEFGNDLKKALGWPEELCKTEPSRVTKLKKEIEILKAKYQQLKSDYQQKYGTTTDSI